VLQQILRDEHIPAQVPEAVRVVGVQEKTLHAGSRVGIYEPPDSAAALCRGDEPGGGLHVVVVVPPAEPEAGTHPGAAGEVEYDLLGPARRPVA